MCFSLGSIRATVVSDPSSSDGTIDPVPVKYRRNHRAKRQVRGVKESPENNRRSVSKRLDMFDSAIESLTRVDSNALFRF